MKIKKENNGMIFLLKFPKLEQKMDGESLNKVCKSKNDPIPSKSLRKIYQEKSFLK
jgi:hypothetical protein